jgi:xylulokinase
MAFLGIDLGTSALKALVLDEQGRTLSVGRAGYEVRAPRPGWAEGDPEEWWQATLAAVREAVAQAGPVPITAIGICGQMHGVVLIGADGEPVRPALLWPDRRAEGELARYRALPASLQERLANPIVPGMAGPLLCWLTRHEPGAYQAAHRALQPKDWLRWRLTGTVAAEPSDASATLLYDLPGDAWAGEVIDALGLKRALFAALLPSGAQAGALSQQAAQALGLPAGLPVAAGAADTAAALLGTGLLQPGSRQLTLGSGAQIVQLCAQPLPDPTRRTHLYRAADGEHWYHMAAVQNAGLALDWVCRALAASWDELYASAGAVAPGAGGVVFLPFLTRERPHQRAPHSHGAFLGLRSDHQRMHLLQAALEGVALGIRVALEALPGARATTSLRLAGGGSVHPAWRQLLADVLGRELVAVETADASARGAALLGGLAGGPWATAQDTAPLAPSLRVVAAPGSRQAAYDEAYARYIQVAQTAGEALSEQW